ncbi:MAG: protein kinase [Cellulomonadaceae bacterium]|nr:protein kinase [Cellulomonadaceae bacterium]
MRPTADMALGGRYRLVSQIAVGGMGEVWVAHDESLKRDVAVKVLREEFAGDAGFLERFRTEARNSAGLSHPNIAALYDYGEQEGSGFLVMELVLGEPMSDLLDREPILPTRRLLPILAQTARALHAAHVGGVVHRDVKPGNILLARSGRVKITDFGISMATNQVPMTASGMVMGTAQYLSPEQAIGRAATGASDVYSLGIVAYEALVGHRPFTGPTAVDIAIAHVNTAVPPLPDHIDPALSALVMRMLAKEPEQRPRSAASLARTLDTMAGHTPAGGVPIPYGRHAGTYAPEGAAVGAAVVPGRPLEDAALPAPVEQPPVFEPGPDPQPRPELRVPSTRPPQRRTSTTTGRRWGRVSRPLVVLALMVVFALLGAAFADRIWGPSRASDLPGAVETGQIVMVASTGPPQGSGMIGRDLDEDRAQTAQHTMTARDQ